MIAPRGTASAPSASRVLARGPVTSATVTDDRARGTRMTSELGGNRTTSGVVAPEPRPRVTPGCARRLGCRLRRRHVQLVSAHCARSTMALPPASTSLSSPPLLSRHRWWCRWSRASSQNAKKGPSEPPPVASPWCSSSLPRRRRHGGGPECSTRRTAARPRQPLRGNREHPVCAALPTGVVGFGAHPTQPRADRLRTCRSSGPYTP